MFASLRNLLWPKRQRQPIPTGSMGTLSRLPEDVLTTRVACFFPSGKDYLSLRVASKATLGLTQRAIASRSSCCCAAPNRLQFQMDTSRVSPQLGGGLTEMRASARHVEAMANVFGAGCSNLYSAGCLLERIAALEYFIASTNGGLRVLHLQCAMVSGDTLLTMCRASPKLTSLRGPIHVCIPDATIVAISVACPYLEDVDFSYREGETCVGDYVVGGLRGTTLTVNSASRDSGAYSPAETWARNFPRLHSISCSDGRYTDYQPTRIDGIRATALATNASILDVEACHITREVIEAVVGTPLGDRIETLGEAHDGNETNLEPEALLAAARGFPRLTELYVPEGSTNCRPHFYTPQLRVLHI